MRITPFRLHDPRRRLVAAVVLVAGTGSAAQWRALRSTQNARRTSVTRTVDLERDLDRIRTLRDAPRRATERRRPHEALIRTIEHAMAPAALDAGALTAVWPESPRRIGRSDYLELATRLNLEKVALPQIARFIIYLHALDGSLELTSIRLFSHQRPKPLWDAELAVAYLIYAPRRATTTGSGG